MSPAADRPATAGAGEPPGIDRVAPAELRDHVGAARARGEAFCGAYARRDDGALELRLVWSRGAATRIMACRADADRLPSIVDLEPAAAWDEREAADLFGLRFAGHEPHRALARHPDALEDWTTPVEGDGVHQVAVGPIHAGVIESGHFRFHVVGERVLHVDLRLFYKHRGLEQAAEGASFDAALALAQRACGADAVSNTVAYADAVEQLRGLWPGPETRRARTVLLELERLYNHLNDIGTVCAGVGFAAGAMAFAALKERAMRLNERVAGHRFLFGSVRVGGSAVEIGESGLHALRAALGALAADFERGWRDLRFSGPLLARLDGVGILEPADAARLGAVGPAARASGARIDSRTTAPRLAYPAAFAPVAPPSPSGDVAARLELRALELHATFALLDGLLRAPVVPAGCEARGRPAGTGVGLVESPRGRTLCVVEAAAGRVARLHLRTGSYANWPALAHATTGALLPDFPLINKSFELCYACVDR